MSRDAESRRDCRKVYLPTRRHFASRATFIFHRRLLSAHGTRPPDATTRTVIHLGEMGVTISFWRELPLFHAVSTDGRCAR